MQRCGLTGCGLCGRQCGKIEHRIGGGRLTLGSLDSRLNANIRFQRQFCCCVYLEYRRHLFYGDGLDCGLIQLQYQLFCFWRFGNWQGLNSNIRGVIQCQLNNFGFLEGRHRECGRFSFNNINNRHIQIDYQFVQRQFCFIGVNRLRSKLRLGFLGQIKNDCIFEICRWFLDMGRCAQFLRQRFQLFNKLRSTFRCLFIGNRRQILAQLIRRGIPQSQVRCVKQLRGLALRGNTQLQRMPQITHVTETSGAANTAHGMRRMQQLLGCGRSRRISKQLQLFVQLLQALLCFLGEDIEQYRRNADWPDLDFSISNVCFDGSLLKLQRRFGHGFDCWLSLYRRLQPQGWQLIKGDIQNRNIVNNALIDSYRLFLRQDQFRLRGHFRQRFSNLIQLRQAV